MGCRFDTGNWGTDKLIALRFVRQVSRAGGGPPYGLVRPGRIGFFSQPRIISPQTFRTEHASIGCAEKAVFLHQHHTTSCLLTYRKLKRRTSDTISDQNREGCLEMAATSLFYIPSTQKKSERTVQLLLLTVTVSAPYCSCTKAIVCTATITV
jgi:hypothetical protein